MFLLREKNIFELSSIPLLICSSGYVGNELGHGLIGHTSIIPPDH